ncbi:MAG: Ig-like domain-containing protein [Myxococcota bacterium]
MNRARFALLTSFALATFGCGGDSSNESPTPLPASPPTSSPAPSGGDEPPPNDDPPEEEPEPESEPEPDPCASNTGESCEGQPSASDDFATATESTSTRIDVLANDDFGPDGPGQAALTVLTPPANGEVSIQENQIVYTPAPGFTGFDTFSYEILDANGDAATGAVEVDVQFALLFVPSDRTRLLRSPAFESNAAAPFDVELEDGDQFSAFEVSPDRSSVAFSTSGGDLFVSSMTVGDEVTQLATDVASFQWSPDGTQILLEKAVDELVVIQADGSNPRTVNAPLVAGGNIRILAWAPDGSRIAYIADAVTDNVIELFTVAPDGSDHRRVSRDLVDGGGLSSFSWAPDSSRIGYRADAITDGTTELFTVAPDGSSELRVSQPLATGDVLTFAWAPDSSRIAYSANPQEPTRIELFTVAPDGSDEQKTSPDPDFAARLLAFRWAPDSSRIAYTGDFAEDDVTELFVAAPDGSGAVRVSRDMTEGGDAGFDLEWSQDGRAIAYTADADTDQVAELYVAAPDGSGDVKVSGEIAEGNEASFFAWSPDSRRLAYTVDPRDDGVSQFFTVSPDGSDAAQVATDTEVSFFDWQSERVRTLFF